MWLVGIDVGGQKKGFHVAALQSGAEEIDHLFKADSAVALAEKLRALGIDPGVIAIDCPPKCCRTGPRTRLAERQLHRASFRVQWTRCSDQGPAEWMQNGERLWERLRREFPTAQLIETFPTVATEQLGGSSVRLPLKLLADFRHDRDWKDFVDAAICAEVGQRFSMGRASSVGHDPETGERDELGPIYF